MGDGTTIAFPFEGHRKITTAFDAPRISSDGGLVLLREIDRRLRFIDRLVAALRDPRESGKVRHETEDLVRQRTYAMAAGYEDCNDATTLRSDPILKTCCDRDPSHGADLASQPTLSRLENRVTPQELDRLDDAFLRSYFDRHPKKPKRLILDIDTTDDPTHGQQEFSAFHGFYDQHMYLPLLVFDQDGDVLAAILQPGKPTRNGNDTAIDTLLRIVKAVRQRWPDVPILVRGDSAFAFPDLYWASKQFGFDFLVGLVPNIRLKKLAARLEERARRRFLRTRQKVRLFTSARGYRKRQNCRARNRWPRAFRVLIKVEYSAMGVNIRFVLTNLSGHADELYDQYVQRGESCENSIKDLKNVIKADRLSCHRFDANRFRLLLHAAAYTLMHLLRRAAEGTELAAAQMDTLRIRLLKIGTQVRVTTRSIQLHFSESHPWQALWRLIANRILRGAFG